MEQVNIQPQGEGFEDVHGVVGNSRELERVLGSAPPVQTDYTDIEPPAKPPAKPPACLLPSLLPSLQSVSNHTISTYPSEQVPITTISTSRMHLSPTSVALLFRSPSPLALSLSSIFITFSLPPLFFCPSFRVSISCHLSTSQLPQTNSTSQQSSILHLLAIQSPFHFHSTLYPPPSSLPHSSAHSLLTSI